MAQIRWTRRVRSVLASVANLVGDWFYYMYLVKNDVSIPIVEDANILRYIFLVICIASTFFGLLSILVMGCGIQICMGWKRICGISISNWVSFLELSLEDIPQLVITSLVSYYTRGPLSGQAVFNLTTSSINFILDILDIADEFADDRAESNEQGEDTTTNNGDAAAGGQQEAQLY